MNFGFGWIAVTVLRPYYSSLIERWLRAQFPVHHPVSTAAGRPGLGYAPFGKGIDLNQRFVLITGCSGGGKSTLLAELRARGHEAIEEPGRRIVTHELQTGGRALPWIDEIAFAERTIATALIDRETAKRRSGWIFFDRGLIDAASALEYLSGKPVLEQLNTLHPYHRRVFLAPPWPEIYVKDTERRHGLEAGVAEYERLYRQLPALGYQVFILPKTTVSARADFVLTTLRTESTECQRPVETPDSN